MAARIQHKPTRFDNRLVSTIEQHWATHHAFPSLTIIAKSLAIDYEDVQIALKTPTIRKMLENRGIEQKSIENQLSPAQVSAARAYLNVFDRRPIQEKLRDLGINPSTFWGWMRGKAFKNFLMEQSEMLFEDGMPIAHRELLSKVAVGDIHAIKLFYEVSGRYTGAQSVEIQNMQLLMSRLLEAIQMEVGDQETIARIAERFQTLAAGGTLSQPRSISGVVSVETRTPGPVGAFKDRMAQNDYSI